VSVCKKTCYLGISCSIFAHYLFCCAAITALGTFMSIGCSLQRRRPSIREHLLTYLLELLASIQRHGLKALHPTPSHHYLDHWVEPVQIRVSFAKPTSVTRFCQFYYLLSFCFHWVFFISHSIF